jgi:hypothetical protein
MRTHLALPDYVREILLRGTKESPPTAASAEEFRARARPQPSQGNPPCPTVPCEQDWEAECKTFFIAVWGSVVTKALVTRGREGFRYRYRDGARSVGIVEFAFLIVLFAGCDKTPGCESRRGVLSLSHENTVVVMRAVRHLVAESARVLKVFFAAAVKASDREVSAEWRDSDKCGPSIHRSKR